MISSPRGKPPGAARTESLIFPGLLPLAILLLLTAALRCGRRSGEAILREDLLGATLILGVVMGLGTELLGVFGGLDFRGVLGFWAAASVAAAALFSWRWCRTGPPAPLRFPRPGLADGLLLGGTAALALALLLVAWLAPPQSSDSLSYHMGRVMHWIQDRSLAPYPTGDSRQLFQPPFAEIVRLNLLVLSGSDRSGCLLQWFAATVALAGASLVARDLGGGRRAQIFAPLFALTLPIGITQASSGKNGWVEAVWLLALAHFSGAAASRNSEIASPGAILAAFAALALDLMTKITSWIFALPIALLAAARAFRRGGRRFPGPALAGIVLACALTLPFLIRNVSVFGNPVADPVFRASDGLEHVTPSIVLSNMVRNALFQFGTRSPAINRVLLSGVVRVHRLLGADPFDPRTSESGPFAISAPSRIEEMAPSPIHIAVVAGVAIALAFSRRLRAGGARIAYFAAIGAAYVLFCATVRWQPPNCRLLMPLLVLAAPIAAVVVGEAFGGRTAPALAAILLITCVPFVVGTSLRPLSFEPGRGLLATPRLDLYFAGFPALRAPFEEAARTVRSEGVRNLGIVFPGGEPEYLLWVMLEDLRPRIRIEHVAVGGSPAALASRPPFAAFRPEKIFALAGDSVHPHFDTEISTGGGRYELVWTLGFAGFYEPVTERRNP